jgi:glycerophosphoryl diester phosphodiesterase
VRHGGPWLRIDLARRRAPAVPGLRPLRIAHRGASARAPENTLAAFREAARLGADAIECDVRLCGDGKPVVIHDDTVDRTTDGRGAVARLALADLRRLDAGSWFATRFRGERIPTLEETFEFARGRCGLNLEVKGAAAGRPAPGVTAARAAAAAEVDATIRAVARSLAASGFREPLIVSSFSRQALIQARSAMPRVRLGLLVSRSLRGLRSAHRQARLDALHPHLRLASRRRVRLAHGLGLMVLFWTVNERHLMQRLLRLGADGLMTDDPALFLDLRAGDGKRPFLGRIRHR